MIAAQNDRQRLGSQCLADGIFDIGVAFFGVGMNDIRIAHIHDSHSAGQIDDIVLMVVGAGMAEGKQGGCFPDTARAEPCSGAVLGAEIKGRADDGNIGINRVPV